jgi:hypothetical protein
MFTKPDKKRTRVAFIGRARRSGRQMGTNLRRVKYMLHEGQYKMLHAASFREMKDAKRATKYKLAKLAVEKGWRMSIVSSLVDRSGGYPYKVTWVEFWPEPNPIEVMAVIGQREEDIERDRKKREEREARRKRA